MDYFRVHNLRRWTHRFYMAYHMPLYVLKQLGIISEAAFRKPWPAHLGWYLRGFSVSKTNQIWDWIADNHVRKNWRADACQILQEQRDQGALTFLISGTPTPLLKRLAGDADADHGVGTDLEINQRLL